MLDSYQPGKLTLTKNPTFYDPKSQKAGGFEFDEVTFGTPSVNAIQSGTVDMVWQVPPDSVQTLRSQNNLEVFAAPSQVLFVANLCPTTGPFASKTARQALQYAFDRKSINDGALADTGEPVSTLLTPSSPYYNKSLAKTYSYNPKKAKAMLKQAGIAPGTTIRAMAPPTAPYPVFADIVKAQLEKVGLDAEFVLPNDIGGELLRQAPELSITVQQPSLFSLALGGQRTALNVCGYKNDDIVNALTTANDSTKTPAEQQAAWDTLQKLVLDESTVIPLTTQGVVAVHTDKLKGLEVVNSPWGPQLDSVYMTK
jgi:peptide/nickel transport system substrate-binding protein